MLCHGNLKIYFAFILKANGKFAYDVNFPRTLRYIYKPISYMDSYIAFLDESGAHGFDFTKAGTSTHFVVCAILTDEGNKSELEARFNNIKSNYYPNTELKSSKVGNDEEKRIRILTDLKELDFKYYCLVVDKRGIYPDSGLRHKEAFYKFLYGLLYNNLYRTIRSLSIIADQLVSDEFLIGLKKYVEQYHQADLFHQSLSFEKSQSSGLIQLADFIGGTVNRFYSSKSSIDAGSILGLKRLGETTFPQNYKPYTVDDVDIDDEFKEVIADLALLRIKSYLQKNRGMSDPVIIKRVIFLNYIQSIFLYSSKTRFIYTDELISHIEDATGEKVKEQYFRQQIVAPLRTEGILIASNSNGYKVPSSTLDIYAFFNLFSKVIHPMIDRLKISYQSLLMASNGKLDILANPEYEYLKKLMD